MNLENLIGNKEIKDKLISIVENKKVVNSYLFIGEEGIGKKEFAKEFSRMILCEKENFEKDIECDSCIKFISENHPDFFIIEKDENSIKIDQIRNLVEKSQEKPVLSKRKVYIINDADSMTKEAQNSLLKTLEEPPEYIVIILIASNENNLLTTIKSRCTKINFNRIEKEELKKYIKDNNCSIGKIFKIKESIEIYKEINNLFNKLLENKLNSKIDFINESEIIYKSKEEIKDILDYINIIFYKEIRKGNNILIDCIEIIEDAKLRLSSNCNFDMTIDNMLFKIWEEINEKHNRC